MQIGKETELFSSMLAGLFLRSKVSLLAYKCFEEILLFLPLQKMKFRSKRFCYVLLNKTKCYLYQMLSESSQILYTLQLYTRLSTP